MYMYMSLSISLSLYIYISIHIISRERERDRYVSYMSEATGGALRQTAIMRKEADGRMRRRMDGWKDRRTGRFTRDSRFANQSPR